MVSIIIPAYNVEKYLRECLDSAIGQTFSDIEVLVVDDGSTDSTPEIIREYEARDSRVRAITRSNGGLSEARNSGLDSARGERVVFLDGDDLLAPSAVSRLVEAAEQSGAHYVEGRRIQGTDSSRISLDARPSGALTVYAAETYIEKVLYQDDVYPSAWCKMFSRSLFDNLRFRPGILYEDLDIFYLLAEKAGKIAVIQDQLYFYRMNPVSLTHTFSPRRFDVLEVTRRIEEYVSANYPRLLPAARDRRLSAAFNMFGLIAAYDKEGVYSAVADKCWNLICSYRRESLFNPRVRLKNKAGIMLSFFGNRVLAFVSGIVYGNSFRI